MSEAFVPEQPRDWNDEETKVFKLAFDLFDTNKDGFIDLEELDTGFIQLGQQQRRSVLVRMIETVDANQDHQIDFPEFIELMKLRHLDDQLREELEAEEKASATSDDREGKELEELLMARFGNMSLSEDIRRGSLYGRLASTGENSEDIVTALKQMDEEVGKISDEKKKAYIKAKEECPLLMGDKFMLMFLRADSFNAKNAAYRYVTYWEKRLEIFGADRAFLPLTQGGALKDDAFILSKGILKHTGKKDENNQVVLFLDFHEHNRNVFDKNAMVREFWYSYHAALEEEDAQKNGIVILVRAPNSLSEWDPLVSKQYVDSIRFCLPTRLASGHVINPPLLIRVMFRIIDLFAGNLRAVRKTHSGPTEKVLKQLSNYGINNNIVPTELGGELVMDHANWLKHRKEAGM